MSDSLGELLAMHESIGTPWLWFGFVAFVLAMLALDLGVFHKKDHEVSVKEALLWTGVWISLAMLFNAGIYYWFGHERALEFLSGYVIEKALSVDNIFVFIVIFSVFAVPAQAAASGAVVRDSERARAARAVRRARGRVAHPLSLAGLCVRRVLGVHRHQAAGAARGGGRPAQEPVIQVVSALVPSVDEFHDGHFTIVQAGKRYATPLLLVLIAIETTDHRVRDGLDSRDLRGHARSVHRFHVEHFRHPRPARAVLRARRHDGQVPLPEVRAWRWC